MKEKILIVDDDAISLEFIKIVLEDQEYEVQVSDNGLDVFDIIETFIPDIILLDIAMPDISGFELCEKLKGNSITSEIPILFISGQKTEDSILRGFEVGGVDYVNKPFNNSELIARIKTHLRIRKLQNRVKNKAEENETLLRILSHDLSNIFSGLLGFSELGLMKSEKDSDAFRYFSNILLLLDRSDELVQSVRKMIAIDSGKIKMNLQPTSLISFIQNANIIFSKKLKEKGICIITDPPNISDEILINVDSVLFQNSIFNNLISNAIKFSYPNSNICIEIIEEGKKVSLSIIDSGIGILREKIPFLFSSQKRTSSKGTNGEIGTGFGLPLVKKMADNLSININIESKHIDSYPENHGTKISLLFCWCLLFLDRMSRIWIGMVLTNGRDADGLQPW